MIPLKQEKHNSLIDIYKLIFAFIVLFYHNCFFIPNNLNENIGKEAVCFFFLISGFYLYTSCDKFLKNHKDDKNYLLKFIWNKLKKLGIPTLIGYIASVINTFVDGEFLTGFMHYLWYIHIMLIFECIFIVLLKKLNIKTINIIMGSTLIIAFFIYVFIESIPSEIKAFIFIPYGYFISCFNLKRDKSLLKLISLIFLTILSLFIVTNEGNEIIRFSFMFVILPLIFLLINMIEVKDCKWTKVLSRISLVIYVYQPFIRWLGTEMFNLDWFNYTQGAFVFISVLTIITIGIEHLFTYFKLKKASL